MLFDTGREECFAMAMVILPHSRHQLGLHQRIQPVRLGQGFYRIFYPRVCLSFVVIGSGVQLQDLQVDLFLLHKLRLPKVPGQSHDPIINYILIDYILINYSFINCIFINYIVVNYIAVNCIVLNAIISIICFVISPPCLTRRSLSTTNLISAVCHLYFCSIVILYT